MSDDTTPPPPSTPPPAAPPPPPSYGGTPPPPPPAGYGTPPPAYGAPVGQPPAQPYASWGQRALATLIDAAPVLGIYIVYIILAAIMPTAIDVLLLLVVVVGAFGWVVYNYGMQQGSTGYTLGKGIVGIKLIGEQDGQPVGTGMAVARYFVHFIDSLPCYLGYLWPLWDDKKQTFTDKILNHVVITAPKQ